MIIESLAAASKSLQRSQRLLTLCASSRRWPEADEIATCVDLTKAALARLDEAAALLSRDGPSS